MSLRFQILKWWLCLTVFSLSAWSAQYFTAPEGRSDATGTITDPLSLAKAMGKESPLRPGDTNWLREGYYLIPAEGLEVLARGQPSSPIVFRAWRGEHPTLVGRLEVKGDDLWFWGLHLTSRAVPDKGLELAALQLRQQEGILPQAGLNVESAERARFINCVLHQITEHALIWGHSSIDSEITGCLILNSCLLGNDNARGEAVYAQNLEGQKKFQQNILLQNVAGGLGMYSANRAAVRNFTVVENIFQANGLEPQNPLNCHAGSESPIDNITLSSNVFWNPPGSKLSNFRMSNIPTSASQIYFVGNLFVHGGAEFAHLGLNFQFLGNKVFGGMLDVAFVGSDGKADARVDSNEYYSTRFSAYNAATPISMQDATPSGFQSWKSQSSYDARSFWTNGLPSTREARLFANPYEPGRGHLAVLNFAASAVVEVDVSALGWKEGQAYEVRTAQDYFGTVLKGIYRGRKIALPMTGWRTDAPNCSTHSPVSSFPEFGVFILTLAQPATP